MSNMPFNKYKPFTPIQLADRTWPGKTITRAPLWCSVDLRDGNQALVEPMGPDRKRRMFAELVAMGFKEIEVGFPSASQPDFDFVRILIEEDLIPPDVTIQVLTQAREHLIRRSFEAIAGARRAIVHLYNSTSPLQRRVVFGMDRAGVKQVAVLGTQLVKQLTSKIPETEVLLEYSPESFTGTELDFSLEVCHAVMDVWQPTADRKIILNLPATVELATPNIYADQVEWFSRNLRDRSSVVLSLHPHNDRGTAVAAAELGMMAGADRVEGTLFGNGERTGNVDVITLALNLLTQGVDPELEIHDIDSLVQVAEYCNRLPVHPRHPYAGTLVFTAFSGSHQDAIRKGIAARRKNRDELWEVPYLPIDPADLGRTYEAIIRINSQSGKGGVGYVLENNYGFRPPRALLVEVSQRVQAHAEQTGLEISPEQIVRIFRSEFLENDIRPAVGAFTLNHLPATTQSAGDPRQARLELMHADEAHFLSIDMLSDPVRCFVEQIQNVFQLDIALTEYHCHEHEGQGHHVAYVELTAGVSHAAFGIGRGSSELEAGLTATVRALNRLLVRAQDLSINFELPRTGT